MSKLKSIGLVAPFFLFVTGCDIDFGFNAKAHWDRFFKQSELANRELPSLTDEGKLPVQVDAGVKTAELSPMARSFYGENKRVSNARIKAAGYRFVFSDYRVALDHMWKAGDWRGEGEADAASPINAS